jgi:membrane protein YdbS with pleckstrin-like domain
VPFALSLGLYAIWRQATWFTVTDQRVIVSKGILTRTQRSIPIDMVQDATVTTQLGVGTVVVTAAGGRASALRIGPVASSVAHEMADAILAQRRGARAF